MGAPAQTVRRMVDEVDPKVMADIRKYVAALAEMEYPRVWVGKAGTTTEDLLPEPTDDSLDGLWVLENLRDELGEDMFAELAGDVRPILGAKRGTVPVVRSWKLSFEPMDEIADEDVVVAKAVTEEGFVLVPGVPVYEYVPVEELSAHDVDESLLDELSFRVAEGPETMGPYIIEDSPRVRAALLGD
jgi:hypothetical protein